MASKGYLNQAAIRRIAMSVVMVLGITFLTWSGVAWAQATAEEPADPLAVEVITSDITIEVTSNGYAPESNVLIGIHGDGIDPAMYLISPEGEVMQAWRVTNRPDARLLDRRLLPNGNIMFTIWRDGAYEMTQDGEVIWSYQTEEISHHAEMLPNGNVLTVSADCNCVREIDYETQEEVWYWNARQVFPDYGDDEVFHGGSAYNISSLYSAAYEQGGSWAHANYAQVLESGNVIVSLRNLDVVLEVTREGDAVWSFGTGVIQHQHTPVDLEDGTMLIFDNGNHRAIRIDRASGEVLWQYDELDSAIMGDVNLLSDGNYKVVDSVQHRVNVVSPDEDLLWSIHVTGGALAGC